MPRSDIQRRARTAIFRSAILSPQSLSLGLISILGAGLSIEFLGASPIVWLIFGAIAEIVYLGSTVTDVKANSRAVAQMFQREFNPAEIKNRHARQRLEQSLEYYRNMQVLATQTAGARRIQIDATIREVDDWVEQIFRIAKRIDNFKENTLIARDHLRVPDEIKMLQQRLATETDAGIQDELADAISIKYTQLQNLEALENNIKRADIQLDNTLSALATVYTQLQLLDSKSIQGGRAHRIKEEINHEVLSLKDMVDAIDDVQSTSSYTFTAQAS